MDSPGSRVLDEDTASSNDRHAEWSVELPAPEVFAGPRQRGPYGQVREGLVLRARVLVPGGRNW